MIYLGYIRKMEVPKPKPKKSTKTQEDFNKKVGAQFANLELRAELEPYLRVNPLARLGFDMIERGEVIGDLSRPGGEILAGLQGGEEGFDAYGLRKGFRGIMLPSSRYTKSANPDSKPFLNAESFSKEYPLTTQVLQKQGIASLLPPEEGSTIYYDTGEDDTPRGADLSTLMEELAHLGMRKLQTDRGKFTNMPLRREEDLMDLMQGRAGAESEGYARELDKDKYRAQGSMLDKLDQAALEELGMRGVPPQREQVSPTVMEKILGMFS